MEYLVFLVDGEGPLSFASPEGCGERDREREREIPFNNTLEPQS